MKRRTTKELYNQNEHVFWDRVDLKWRVKKHKVLYTCPHCKSKNTLEFEIFVEYDLKIFNLVRWRCTNCSNQIHFKQFPKDTKNHITNKVIPELQQIHFNPVDMKIKEKKSLKERIKEYALSDYRKHEYTLFMISFLTQIFLALIHPLLIVVLWAVWISYFILMGVIRRKELEKYTSVRYVNTGFGKIDMKKIYKKYKKLKKNDPNFSLDLDCDGDCENCDCSEDSDDEDEDIEFHFFYS